MARAGSTRWAGAAAGSSLRPDAGLWRGRAASAAAWRRLRPVADTGATGLLASTLAKPQLIVPGAHLMTPDAHSTPHLYPHPPLLPACHHPPSSPHAHTAINPHTLLASPSSPAQGSNEGLRAFCVAKLLEVKPAAGAKKGGAAKGRPGQLRVQRFYRPEDISAELAYGSSYWDLYAPAGKEGAGAVWVDAEDVYGKCAVVQPGGKYGGWPGWGWGAAAADAARAVCSSGKASGS
jgi:hypothetical protein